MICPKCSNTIGFAFGECVDCGWNHISNNWGTIKVNPDFLPNDIREFLIKSHEYNLNKRRGLE